MTRSLTLMQSVAIIGTGISGMGAAHRLKGKFHITLFEKETYHGGHTRTESFDLNGEKVAVDTGFMVYNELTYPLLTELFKDLQVKTIETDMSFSVKHITSQLEYCGSSLNQLFAQRKNLAKPKFWRMVRDILKFNKAANLKLKKHSISGQSLASFVQELKLGKEFLDLYLIPMTSAIWSTPPNQMLEFPAQTLIRFLYNHGLLGISTQHQWRTVVGGSKNYRDKLMKPFENHIKRNSKIVSINRTLDAVELIDAKGINHRFDHAIIATHADQALELLSDPNPTEKELLGHFKYTKNKITLHTDEAVMPKSKRAWASWNYAIDSHLSFNGASTHYWMNSLQHLDCETNVFVSVNGDYLINRNKIIKQFVFDHPVFTEKSTQAQKKLHHLNQQGKTYYAGSYFKYGFHEDALRAGYGTADRLIRNYGKKTAEFAV